MARSLVLVTAPVATRSGYGAHARDIVRSLIKLDKYDKPIVDTDGNESWYSNELILNSGCTITTACNYDADASFGDDCTLRRVICYNWFSVVRVVKIGRFGRK